MKRIHIFAWVVALLLTFFVCLPARAQKVAAEAVVTCPGGTPSIDHPYVTIVVGDSVKFTCIHSGQGGCLNGVTITGVIPQTPFDLINTNGYTKTVAFNSVGTFWYKAHMLTEVSGRMMEVAADSGVVVVKVNLPTTTHWSMIILIGLILVTGIYLWVRRKPATA